MNLAKQHGCLRPSAEKVVASRKVSGCLPKVAQPDPMQAGIPGMVTTIVRIEPNARESKLVIVRLSANRASGRLLAQLGVRAVMTGRWFVTLYWCGSATTTGALFNATRGSV
jgi:hypothetical protein